MKVPALIPVTAMAAAGLIVSGCPIGLTAGINWASFTGDGVVSDDTLQGERVGGVLVLGPQKIAFMGEVLHVRKGAENALLTGMATPANIELQYAQLTYMLRLGMAKYWSFFTGPYTAFIVDVDTTAPIPGTNPSDLEGDVADAEAGWVFGIGLKLAFLVLDFRYEFGLNSVFDSPGTPDIKNSALALNLTLKF